MTYEVLGLGAVAMDIVLNCNRLPEEDGYVVIKQEYVTPGGSCANILTALAGLGTKAGLIACLGDDAHGRALISNLRARGVSTQHVVIKKGGVSMHTYVAVAPDGTKVIFCNMGDSLLSLTEQDVPLEALQGVVVFYTALQPIKPALKLARLCREKGIPVVCNLQVESDFLDSCGVSQSLIQEMLSLCELFITFKRGLARHAGKRDLKARARSLYETYRPSMGLIVTLGEEGALWWDQGEPLYAPAFKVEAKDTTGAGDAFIAGIIHAKFSERGDRESALKFASACAALKCTQPGPCLDASKADIVKFMEQYDAL